MNDLNVQRELFSREMVVSKGSREAEKVAVVEGSDRCRHIALGVRGADVRRCRRPASRCWHKRWPTTITHARWRARIVQSRKMLGVRYTRKKIESGPTYFSFGARPSAPAASQSPRCLNWDISSFSNSAPLLSSLSLVECIDIFKFCRPPLLNFICIFIDKYIDEKRGKRKWTAVVGRLPILPNEIWCPFHTANTFTFWK